MKTQYTNQERGPKEEKDFGTTMMFRPLVLVPNYEGHGNHWTIVGRNLILGSIVMDMEDYEMVEAGDT